MTPLVDHLRAQGVACAALRSPMYGQFCEFLAVDVAAKGITFEILHRWAGADADPDQLNRDVPGLRLLGGLHRLVLLRQAPELALFYPSVGGSADPANAWPVLSVALDRHRQALAVALELPPQTNEVGRAAPLRKGLAEIAYWSGGMPIRLVEIGASAGLNLRVDQLPIGLGQLIDPGPQGIPREDAPQYEIVERIGGDLDPIDPTSQDGRTTLTSYVWPDDLLRFERLRVALELALEIPVDLRKVGAADLVESLKLKQGTVTVLWHSVMWQYVSQAERERVRAAIAQLGAAATEQQRFAHLRFEPRNAGDPLLEIALDSWPGANSQLLGLAPPHGI